MKQSLLLLLKELSWIAQILLKERSYLGRRHNLLELGNYVLTLGRRSTQWTFAIGNMVFFPTTSSPTPKNPLTMSILKNLMINLIGSCSRKILKVQIWLSLKLNIKNLWLFFNNQRLHMSPTKLLLQLPLPWMYQTNSIFSNQVFTLTLKQMCMNGSLIHEPLITFASS